MTEPPRGTRGASFIDILVMLAAFAIVAALAYPRWAARGFREQVQTAIEDVDAAAARARSTISALGRWPSTASAGRVPEELTGLEFARPTYALEWTTWHVIDSVPARTDDVGAAAPGDAPNTEALPMEPVARRIGAVAVHSSDDSLLAELLRHYGATASFVLDTTLYRLLPDRAPTP